MTKFFRKIRQRLLSENKLSKYLIYAIGEIALVVIGILIALSVNNSNQKRIEQKTTNNYLEKINSNIKQNINFSKTMLEFRNEHSANCNKVAELIIDKDFSNQSIFQSAIFSSLIERPINYDRDAFESLKNSGNLANIENSIIETALLEYYELVDKIIKQEKNLEEFNNQMELELVNNGFLTIWMNLDKEVHKDLTKQITNYTENLIKHPGHDNILMLLFRGGTNTTFLTGLYEEQVKSGMALSQTIKDYIILNK